MQVIMSAALLVILFLVIVFGYEKRYGGYMPETFRNRPCQGFVWKRAFPDSPNDEIRDFLYQFTQAFGYRRGQMLQVAPEDTLIAIYRAEYPPGGFDVDQCELEALAIQIKKKYKVEFTILWSETLTFGMLFTACCPGPVITDTLVEF